MLCGSRSSRPRRASASARVRLSSRPEVPAPDDVARELAGEQRQAAPERGQGIVDVVGEQDAVVAMRGGQPWPEAEQRRAQQFDVGVDERDAQEVGAHGERRGSRVALVAVALAGYGLLVPGEHGEGAAEHVDVQRARRSSSSSASGQSSGPVGAVEDGQPLVAVSSPAPTAPTAATATASRGSAEVVSQWASVGGEQHVGNGDDAFVVAFQPDPDVGVLVHFGPPLQTQPLAEHDPEDIAPFGPYRAGARTTSVIVVADAVAREWTRPSSGGNGSGTAVRRRVARCASPAAAPPPSRTLVLLAGGVGPGTRGPGGATRQADFGVTGDSPRVRRHRAGALAVHLAGLLVGLIAAGARRSTWCPASTRRRSR